MRIRYSNPKNNDLLVRGEVKAALLDDTPFDSDAETLQRCIEAIDRVPASDVAPARKGQWIPEPDRYYHWHCSECGYVIGVMKMDADYCLKCGADMREEKDDGESTK